VRTKLAVLISLALLLATWPAAAEDLFRAGVISCSALSRSVTALSVNRCSSGENKAKGEMFGSCEGSYVANRSRIPFVVSAYVKQIGKALPDNNRPLRFDYRGGVRCQVNSWRVRSVHNCTRFADGDGLACDVCFFMFGKQCYNARMVVTARH
jgi:hypothetical protein